ncbi:MAG TPA: anthranilate synthase component I, partial [Candidatus Tenderia electrophaga]|nr:anthranilate synthase component I [Candidatus Tenderia electrophaga]
MTREEFDALAAEGYNRIPMMREVLADLDTPLSTYLKLANGPYSYLFESVEGGEKWGRFSIIGLPCRTILRVHGHEMTVEHEGKKLGSTIAADPLAAIEAFREQFRVPEVEGLPLFTGGLVGYFGYDTVRYIEPRLDAKANKDELDVPDILLMVSDEVVVFDNLLGRLYVVVHVDPSVNGAYKQGQQRLDDLVVQLRKQPLPAATTKRGRKVKERDFRSGFKRDKFEAAVDKIKDYILEGDCMQVVLSQRLSIPYKAESLDLYRALRSLNPSPYMFYLNLDGFQVAGSSPEILARLEDGEVTVRPIAGTRPRGKTAEEDLALEKELLADPKELAEHLMLIDLGRNDAGRISETGSVKVTDEMAIERYSHVMHIVSNVTGKLKAGMNAIDVLRATFPAGTLSGAPKIR